MFRVKPPFFLFFRFCKYKNMQGVGFEPTKVFTTGFPIEPLLRQDLKSCAVGLAWLPLLNVKSVMFIKIYHDILVC